MNRSAYLLVNFLSLYRILASPFLAYLIFTHNYPLFGPALALSFFTDLIDGPLARYFKVKSRRGALLDSIGDDLTVLCGLGGLMVFFPGFLQANGKILLVLLSLFGIQTLLALYKFKKITSLHTYLAKLSAILQGSFLILSFWLPEIPLKLFYVACTVTLLELIEEIIITIKLRRWEVNVRGLYWVIQGTEAYKKDQARLNKDSEIS